MANFCITLCLSLCFVQCMLAKSLQLFVQNQKESSLQSQHQVFQNDPEYNKWWKRMKNSSQKLSPPRIEIEVFELDSLEDNRLNETNMDMKISIEQVTSKPLNNAIHPGQWSSLRLEDHLTLISIVLIISITAVIIMKVCNKFWRSRLLQEYGEPILTVEEPIEQKVGEFKVFFMGFEPIKSAES